ncbi:hypothetical protein ACP275_06G160000 [Erythranthe tilingii]
MVIPSTNNLTQWSTKTKSGSYKTKTSPKFAPFSQFLDPLPAPSCAETIGARTKHPSLRRMVCRRETSSLVTRVITETKAKICLKSFKVESMLSGPCGHPFCTNCWKSYIAASIDSGPGCLGLRCPEPKCKPYPGLELIDSLASDYNKGKYYKYLLGSYVEGCWNLKWCPGPGCNLCWKVG